MNICGGQQQQLHDVLGASLSPSEKCQRCTNKDFGAAYMVMFIYTVFFSSIDSVSSSHLIVMCELAR
jgi:hypothetical protein